MSNAFDASLGRNIRYWRQKRNLTQEQLAHRAGLTLNFVGQVERGKRGLSAKSLHRLSHALGVPIQKLYEGIPPPKNAANAAEESPPFS